MILPTKKCERCGWEYPITYPKAHCRWCGAKFKKGFCNRCGEYAAYSQNKLYCKKCASRITNDPKYSDRYYRRPLKQATERFNKWLELIAAVPQPIKTLTEEEWIATCLHFNKCALCRNEDISARAFFIPFKFGGRYAAWNVIPVCEKCALELHIQLNPFIRYDRRLNPKLREDTKNLENINKIVAYLQPILERTINDNIHGKT